MYGGIDNEEERNASENERSGLVVRGGTDFLFCASHCPQDVFHGRTVGL
jgi:hypothetical protein